MENVFQLNATDVRPQTPRICGYLSTNGMTIADGDAGKNFFELEGQSISIVGKNG